MTLAIYCLGQEDFDASAVHITKGTLETTAVCGHYPVGVVTTGVDEDQFLCDECTDGLEAMEDFPAFVTVMWKDDAEAES